MAAEQTNREVTTMLAAKTAREDLSRLRELPKIMEQLVQRPQWVVWRYAEARANGKRSKTPFSALNDRPASTTAPDTWCSFHQALARLKKDSKFDGIGFVFTADDPFCGIDLDNCLSGDGKLLPWAKPIVEKCATYGEISPSGRGIKLFTRANLPGKGRRSGNIEMYDQERYFTVTGSHFEGTPKAIEDRQCEVETLYAEITSPDSPTPRSQKRATGTASTDLSLKDRQLIEQARNARNGENFKALFDNGDLSAYGQDKSRADLALCCYLAFWCKGDDQSIDRLFRKSALMRPKWDSPRGQSTYGAQTIKRALESISDNQVSESTDDRSAKRRSPVEVALEIVKDFELFHTPDGTGYASMFIDGHRETWSLRSSQVKKLIIHRYYERMRRTLNTQAQNDVLATLEAQASYKGPKETVHKRIAERDGAIYLDLVDPKWRCVEITDNNWRVVEQSPVRFIRTQEMLELPEPSRGGSLKQLRTLVNLPDDDSFILYIAFLVACLRPNGPYPILILQGEQGSAKSTAAKLAKRLIDPTEAPLRSLPKSEHDLVIAAKDGWLLAFDNLSGMPQSLSDPFCRLSTGSGFATRKLYTDDELYIFSASRPVILNGIDDIGVKQDLLNRSIVLTLEAVPDHKRRPLAEIEREFEEMQPKQLGALLDAVSCALKNHESIQLSEYPRMADFAKWIVAAEPALPWRSGEFVKAYKTNCSEAVESSLELDPVVIAIRSFFNKSEHFKGSATELLKMLEKQAGVKCNAREWPKNPQALSKHLRSIGASLGTTGIAVNIGRESERSRSRFIELKKCSKDIEEQQINVGPSDARSSVSDALRTQAPTPPSGEFTQWVDGVDDTDDLSSSSRFEEMIVL